MSEQVNVQGPLIYTKDGNVPQSELTMTEEWDDHVQSIVTLVVEGGQLKPVVTKQGYINHKIAYHSKATGELVRNDVYVCVFGNGEAVGSEQGLIG